MGFFSSKPKQKTEAELQRERDINNVEIWFMENVPFEYDIVSPAINGTYIDRAGDVSAVEHGMILNLKTNAYDLGSDAIIAVKVNTFVFPPDSSSKMSVVGYEAHGVAVKRK